MSGDAPGVSTARSGDPENASRGAAVDRAKADLGEALEKLVNWETLAFEEREFEWLAEIARLPGGAAEARERIKRATLGELIEWKDAATAILGMGAEEVMESENDERMSLESARYLAEMFRQQYIGFAERWEIAGSIRRGKDRVGDIEHVVIPKYEENKGGLFGETMSRTNLLWAAIEKEIDEDPETVSRALYGKNQTTRWGELYRGVSFGGITHEIFLAEPMNWGAILAIRTGPASLSKQLVSSLKAAGLYRQDGGYLIHNASGNKVIVADEETYFKFACTPYLAPKDRK